MELVSVGRTGLAQPCRVLQPRPHSMASSSLPLPNTTGFRYTEPPHPEWTYGQGVEATANGRAWAEGEKAGWKTIDTATEDPRFVIFAN